MELLLTVHSLLRYIILLLAVIVIYQSFVGLNKQTPIGNVQNKISLALLVSTHVMLVIGLYQYIFGAQGIALFKANGSAVMKDSVLRFFAVEHIFVMVIATVLITMGRALSKKGKSNLQSNKRLFWFTLIALLLILSRIPWPFTQAGAGRGWL
jgi:hypothetical protein